MSRARLTIYNLAVFVSSFPIKPFVPGHLRLPNHSQRNLVCNSMNPQNRLSCALNPAQVAFSNSDRPHSSALSFVKPLMDNLISTPTTSSLLNTIFSPCNQVQQPNEISLDGTIASSSGTTSNNSVKMIQLESHFQTPLATFFPFQSLSQTDSLSMGLSLFKETEYSQTSQKWYSTPFLPPDQNTETSTSDLLPTLRSKKLLDSSQTNCSSDAQLSQHFSEDSFHENISSEFIEDHPSKIHRVNGIPPSKRGGDIPLTCYFSLPEQS